MLHLMHLKPGERVRLKNGSIAEVVDNMGDGIWLQLRFVAVHGGDFAVGDEELVHCEEIAGLAEGGA